MKRRILATATLVATITLATSPASAAVSAVGWWTRNPTASAPEGGIQVAKGPDGTISYGAVRAVEDGDDIETAMLTIQESGQAVNASGASIQACPAAGTWSAGKGASFGAGPLADCKAGSVALVRNAQGQWTADVKSVLQGDTPAVAIVPGDAAVVFSVSFATPALDVKLRPSSGSGGATSSDFDTNEFSATTSPSSGSSGSTGSSGSGGSSDASDFGSGSSTFQPSTNSFSGSSSGTVGSTGGFSATVEPEAVPQEVAATGEEVAPADAGDGSDSSTFVARPAAAPPLEVGGNRWAQFGLFLLVAAAIGTVAGFGRNRLTAKSA